MTSAQYMSDWRKMDCEEYRRYRRRQRARNVRLGLKQRERVTNSNAGLIVEKYTFNKIMGRV
jgi:hypothetical protein